MSSFVRLGAFLLLSLCFCFGGAEQTQRGGGFTLLLTGTIVSFGSLKKELGSSATATSAGPTAHRFPHALLDAARRGRGWVVFGLAFAENFTHRCGASSLLQPSPCSTAVRRQPRRRLSLPVSPLETPPAGSAFSSLGRGGSQLPEAGPGGKDRFPPTEPEREAAAERKPLLAKVYGAAAVGTSPLSAKGRQERPRARAGISGRSASQTLFRPVAGRSVPLSPVRLS
ncbi:uncharacterized protein WM294_013217 [Sarcoramphus papa]